jgi:hypothetical protein
VQVDLGTDAKHCSCKAGDLLAVVEWHLCISANFDKTDSIQWGSQLGSPVSVKLNEIFRLSVLKSAQHQGIGCCCFLCSVLLDLPPLMCNKRELCSDFGTIPSCSDRQFLERVRKTPGCMFSKFWFFFV